jgi:hypothetical protein
LISQQEYLRGLAYLDLKDGSNVSEAFLKVTKNPGAAVAHRLQDYAQAELGLARARAMQGDTAGRSKRITTSSTPGKTPTPICQNWLGQSRTLRAEVGLICVTGESSIVNERFGQADKRFCRQG